MYFLRLISVTLIVSLLALPLAAAGFGFFEQGAKATAMGGAFAATADDPSAIFYNVAGIAYQRDMKAMTGGTIVSFANGFKGNDPYPGVEGRAAFEDHTFVLPNMYAIVPIGENLTFGVGQFTPAGLRTDWENGNTFPGRFVAQDSNIKVVSLQPSLAWKSSNDKFALGAGLEYRISHISLERNMGRINPFTQRFVDVAHIRLNSEWNDTWGWNVGLMYRPNEDWSVGLSHRAAVDIDYTGDATFTQIPTGYPQFDAGVAAQLPPVQDIATTIAYPAFTHLGIATHMIPNWTVELDVVHNTWSRFKTLEVEFADTPALNFSVPENWSDAYSYRLGANHPVTDHWDVRLGALYDESPQPLSGAGPLLPDSDRIGVTFGIGYQGRHWSVDLTEMVLIFNDRNTRDLNKDDFNGTYTTAANLIGVNFGYTF